MKRIFVSVAILLLATSVTLATNVDREERKAARHEKREIRKDKREIRKNKRELRKEKREENKTEVSYTTEQQFYVDFPNAKNISFEKRKYFDEAFFTMRGKKFQAYYDYSGNLIGTTINEKFSALPQSAQNQIKKQYQDYSIKEIFKFKDNESNESDITLYGSSFDDADNYFVQLEKGEHDIALKVSMSGNVSFYQKIK